jgi:tetratricopeptide (TPR) repeat protein
VAIAPDGKTAISASEDRTLKIWDLLTGKEVASFSGEGAFDCCAFAPDGVTVVAGDASGRVHFLRLEGMGDLGDAAGLNNPVSLFYSGLALAKQGQYEAALAKLAEVAEIRPDALIVCLEQGKVLCELERYAEAVASLDQAKEIAGKDRDFWFCRGFALSKCDSQEAARESWDFAINIQPDDCDFWFEKAKALFELERYEQTIYCLDLAIKIEPNQAYLWDWRGMCAAKKRTR